MSRYCSICGKKLVKTLGDIGPVCIKKLRPRKRRTKIGKEYLAIIQKKDIFGGSQQD